MQSKKGAIELSMTTIIVIVMGVTLLVLGLVFIRGIYDKAKGLTDEAFADAEREIQQRMGASDKIYVSGGIRWEAEPGEAFARVVGIRNFDPNPDSSASFTVDMISTDNRGETEWFTITQPGNIKAGEINTVPIEVRLPSSIPPGTSYPFRIVVKKGNEEHASQGIIISIKE